MQRDYERRSQPRVQPAETIWVDYPDLKPRVRDMSLAGAYIEDARPLLRGHVCSIRLTLSQQQSVNAKAIVRRTDPGVGMAVEFVEISAEDRRRLQRFLGQAGQASSLPSF
ncbi:MAG: PilZ domain-containing protein [Terriglobia bacterium]